MTSPIMYTRGKKKKKIYDNAQPNKADLGDKEVVALKNKIEIENEESMSRL